MAEEKWWQTRRSRIAFLAGGALALIGGAVWFVGFYPYVSTDDARVAAVMINVAPLRQSGRLLAIHVNEGDRVKKGDLLLEMDHDVAEAGLVNAKARLTYATRELERYTRGLSAQVVTQHDQDLMRRDADIARADLAIAQSNLDDTYLRSPSDGIVVRRLAEVGNLVEAHQTAIVIADVDGAWIAANIEETSVKSVRAGQPVQIHVDEGYDLKGSVVEVIHATASQFALIPTDNASGNFTKVVQRVPIKIAIASDQKASLRAGQSVEIRVKVH